MKIRDALRRSGVAIAPDATVHGAAQLMEVAGVGALAVVEGDRPVGIVTDRDLVRRSMAAGAPGDARVDSVMTTDVVTVDAGADLHSAYAVFRTNGLRRLVVVSNGAFVGILSIDDLLIDLAADLMDLARPVTAETLFGQHETIVLPVAT
jgi:CBS domain-containing protein